MTTQGRNERCACGSGKKFKRCCLTRAEATAKAAEVLARKVQAERRRGTKYGQVRPIISTDFKGKKVVVVGNRLHFSNRWKTFTDFLFDYIPHTMGKEWWDAQTKLPEGERSPVFGWKTSVDDFRKKAEEKVQPGGIYEATPNGPTHAYLSFAYDLYVLRDNLKFQEEIIARLKRREHFYGARYELLVAGTFVRAGFDIKYENESDNRTKHPEFVATHRNTSLGFDVEAKKRQRAQKIGDAAFNAGQARIDVRGLLAGAIGKFRGRPLIIFLDLDLPPLDGNPFGKPWSKELLETQTEAGDRGADGRDKCNLLIYTNYPIDYHLDTYPGFSYIVSMTTVPAIPISSQTPFDDIVKAINQFGKIPNFFDENSNP